MELLAPAGDLDKLEAAWRFGADAAYLGLPGMSLRANTGFLSPGDIERLNSLKSDFPQKKWYAAVNRYCKPDDFSRVDSLCQTIEAAQPDGLIVADLGLFSILKASFPNFKFHLSTQANTLNAYAVALYRDLGFSRIVLARELSLSDIETIRKQVPDIELEVFVHGAMCLALSGRCLISTWTTGRSANSGDCTHSCRWDYKLLEKKPELVLEESKRPGEYYPVIEEDSFTSLMSSKDLSMIAHLDQLKACGVDSIKIEGRMKSVYYVSLLSGLYRKALESLQLSDHGECYRRTIDYLEKELDQLSQRDRGTGFYFGDQSAMQIASRGYKSNYAFLAHVRQEKELSASFITGSSSEPWYCYQIDVKNPFSMQDTVELLLPGLLTQPLKNAQLFDSKSIARQRCVSGQFWDLYVKDRLPIGTILRKLQIETP